MQSIMQKAGAAFAALMLLPIGVAGLPAVNGTLANSRADEPLTCFGPGLATDWNHDDAVKFCVQYDSNTLRRGESANSKAFTGPNGVFYNFHSTAISPPSQWRVTANEVTVTNTRCDTDYIDAEECWVRFDQIMTGCGGPGPNSVGGIISTDCGQYVVLPSKEKKDPPTAGAVVERAIHDILPDGCNPPAWDRCSAEEKAKLLDDACDFRGCLMAGNCTPCSGRVVKRATHDILPSGCNPPAWDRCSAEEKAKLLEEACDFRGCLMAGNCTPC
ncbi:hypothetical protein CERZMDRAFT_84986 [Cercospora zeae-maydis SCOH1-5]|uniref:Uncharacterized protein n=1 Tax=Cercospora zeae-maydis SCOH1-5 TaxID=717836 RepID=A0A6A6FF48_9PEZI|nr:hypothetical protein CERZMDRAFT_84986 [Cercospora zeae-maydis SCOH1-5]